MDNNNWRAAQGQVQIPGQVIGGEWRSRLQQDTRQGMVNKIMEALKSHLHFSGQEGLQKLKKLAVRFEEQVYTAATSLSDYLRMISSKMLKVENKSQNPIANPFQANAASNCRNPQCPVGNSTGQGASDIHANSKRQKIQDRQQQVVSQDSQQYLYNQLGQGGVSQSMMQSQMQKQQQNLLQPNQLQSSQPAVMQSSLRTNQQPVHMLQQSKVAVQQQMQQNMLLNQAQPSQSQQMQQQFMSQIQSQPGQLQQQMGFQQQVNTLPRYMQQRIQTSGPMLQQQTAVDQQKHLLQPQRVMPEVPLTSLDSSSQTGSAGGDWQDEIYQKIKSMHELYYPELNEMYQQTASMLQQHDDIPQQLTNEQNKKLRFLKFVLEHLIMFLRTNKNDILPNHKEKIVGVEKQIVNILNANRPRNPVPSLQQGQHNQSHMHAMQQSQQQQQRPQMHPNEGQMNSRVHHVFLPKPT